MRIVSLVLALLLVCAVAPAALAAQTGAPGAERGGGTDFEAGAAPVTWNPNELTTTTTCDVVGCTERGAEIDPIGLTASPHQQGVLDLWFTWLLELLLP